MKSKRCISAGLVASILSACSGSEQSSDAQQASGATNSSAVVQCQAYQIYDPKKEQCIWTGQAPSSPVGNFIVESLGANFLMKLGGTLAAAGMKVITTGLTRNTAVLTATTTSEWAATFQARITNEAIRKQLSIVDERLVEVAVLHAQRNPGLTTTPLDVSALGFLQGDTWRIAQSVSLGTARAITLKTGREVALVRAGKTNFLVIGTRGQVDLPGSINGNTIRLIYHTHPEVSAAVNKVMHTASIADEHVIIALKQDKSFVIHGADAIQLFWR